ncbi:MAG: beta-lactamase family protein [Gammaproteobacteria bacterium]|nr:beta-lactamase family protein [Gammaproteobacteria bacterium]
MNILRTFFLIILLGGLLTPASIVAASSSHHHSKHQTKKKVAKKTSKKAAKKNSKKLVKKRKTPIISSEDFDKAYLRFLQHWQMPGSSVAILKNNTFILSRGYGWADIENHRSMTPDSVFRIASVSKAITAVAIMQLVQEGKLDLNSKVYDILNDLQPLTNAIPSHRIYSINVRNLLEMSPGWISDRGIDPMLGPWSSKMLETLHHQIPPSCETAARMMMTIPLQYTPGTQFSYSNISYCLLGLVVNKVNHISGANGYEEYVKQHLFLPYGITSMRLGDTTPGKQLENEVHYYFFDPAHSYYSNIDRLNDGLPYGQTRLLQKNFSDGGWVASAPDLARFLHALGRYDILTSKMINNMIAKPSFQMNPNNYFAKGWNVKKLYGSNFILKTGSFTGTQALVMLEENGTAYVALFNAKPSNRKIFLMQLKRLLITYAHTKHNENIT